MISNEAEVKCHIRKKELFDLLTKNINFNETKSICLFSLGSPYYAKRIEKEHPNIKITVVEDEEMKFLFCDMDNVIYANINKELWPKTMENVNFDCIIMNPPYSGNLHLKILQEAIKHADKTVNLSPVRWLQDPLFEYKTSCDYKKFAGLRQNLASLEVRDMDEVNNLFGIVGIRSDMGIYYYDGIHHNGDTNPVPFKPNQVLIKKIVDKYKNILGFDYDIYNGQKYFMPIVGVVHPERYNAFHFNTKMKYIINGVDALGNKPKPYTDSRFSGKDIRGKAFNTKEELMSFYNSTSTRFFMFCVKETLGVLSANWPNIKLLPFMDEVVNPISGKKGYESEWTDEAFYKYFEITEEERKIIEETMEKYK